MESSSSEQKAFLDFRERGLSQKIEPGLERLQAQIQAAGLALSCPLISVAGTNGKGSCCAFIESIASRAGVRTGLYTSPHLLRFEERIRIANAEIAGEELLAAFRVLRERIDVGTLTVFEFDTLLAVQAMELAEVELAVLEVGMGGRLDAVNCWDADVAVISSIGLDHQQWLGTDREQIGYEKAGIFRGDKTLICGDPQPPQSLLDAAVALHTPLYRIDQDFWANASSISSAWEWVSVCSDPVSGIAVLDMGGEHQYRNAATAIAALRLSPLPILDSRIDDAAIVRGLASVALPGRGQREALQTAAGEIELWLDVAHNPDAVQTLATRLLTEDEARSGHVRTFALFACLADKDVEGMVRVLDAGVDEWLLAGLDVERGLGSQDLSRRVEAVTGSVVDRSQTPLRTFVSLDDGFEWLTNHAAAGDRVLVFGSFHTVASILPLLADHSES